MSAGLTLVQNHKDALVHQENLVTVGQGKVECAKRKSRGRSEEENIKSHVVH